MSKDDSGRSQALCPDRYVCHNTSCSEAATDQVGRLGDAVHVVWKYAEPVAGLSLAAVSALEIA